jgi:hypothetical protein
LKASPLLVGNINLIGRTILLTGFKSKYNRSHAGTIFSVDITLGVLHQLSSKDLYNYTKPHRSLARRKSQYHHFGI